MRRFIGLMFGVFLVVILLCNTVFATSNTYELAELELRVSVPMGYLVITRDTPASDSVYTALGTTKAAIMDSFETGNIYLNAISNSHNEEIVVIMTDNILTSFSLLSDTELNFLASALVDQCADYGINVSKYDVYQHAQTKFIRLHFKDTANTVHGLQYYTVYNGKAMNFTMRSYEGVLSSRQETAIKTLVDSIYFDNVPSVSVSNENTDPFAYTDTESGITFTVPANWKQEQLTDDREFIDVKFVSNREDGCMMCFGSIDAWSQMSALDREGCRREDIDNSILKRSDIAEMYGITADKVSTVTYNETQYYKIEFTTEQEVYGLDFSVTMTQLVYIDNGWMYLFQFVGTSDHMLYSDFETLIRSVEYPASSAGTNELDINFSVVAGALLVVVAAVVVVVLLAQRKKKENEFLANQSGVCDMPEANQAYLCDEIAYCINCGQQLPRDSVFCHFCGTKVFVEE